MVKTFLQFMNESSQDDIQSQDPKKPTLFIIDDIGYDSPDVQWFMSISIIDIWKEYESKIIDFQEFVKKYKEKITEKKSEIEKISDSCWYDIKEIMDQSGEYNEEKSNKYFNRIYDWGDQYGIKIDTGVKPEVSNDETQNDETQIQNDETQNNNTIQ